MEYKTIQILISTMNQKDISFLRNMNIKSDVIIGNQNGQFGHEQFIFNRTKIDYYCSNEKGLSNNRNLTLAHAHADICLLADDDLVYVDGYERIVRNAFIENSNADIIIFNLYEKPIVRYVIRHPFQVNILNYMRFGSVRIAFKRKSIIEKGITFDSRFGAGSEIPLGEDTIFLHDCLSAGLNIIAIPKYILSLTNERESTWFRGYDELYFRNKGKLYNRISKRFVRFLCIQDAIRHRKDYREYGNCIKVYKTMFKSSKILRKDRTGVI